MRSLTATHAHDEPATCAYVHDGKRLPHLPIFQAGDLGGNALTRKFALDALAGKAIRCSTPGAVIRRGRDRGLSRSGTGA